MNVLQLVFNVEKIAIALIAIIETMPNTLNFTRTLITKIEKLLRRNWPESIRAVRVESQAALKNIASVIRLDCSAEKFVSVSSVRITSLSATKK